MERWLLAVTTLCLTILAGCGLSGGDAGKTAAALRDPDGAAMQSQAPEAFAVRFETSAGTFVVQVERALAPRGADRFYNLVRHGFYDGQRFFRVVPGFVVQWGMSGDPELTRIWHSANIPDDPVRGANTPGTITFAKTQAPNSRSTQVFINLGDNSRHLDGQGFAPFGRVIEGMDVVRAINAEYGQNPSQQRLGEQGNAYLEREFPRLDYIKTARVVD